MSITLIKDIENVFVQAENSIKSKLTGATADIAKKTIAVAQVAEKLAESFVSDAETTWSSLDNSTTATVVANIVNYVNAGSYEKAAFGLFYLIYQSAVEVTTDAESLVEKVVSSIPGESLVVSAVQKVEAETKTIVGDVEADAKKVYADVKNWIAPNTATPTAAPTVTVATPATTTPAPVATAAPATTTTTSPEAVAQTNPTPAAPPAPVLAS